MRERGGGGGQKYPLFLKKTRGKGGGKLFFFFNNFLKKKTGGATVTFLPNWNTSEDRVSIEVERNSGVLSSALTIGWMMRDA